MDRVRFGRALGGGARDAARAILKAADAAAAPSPTPSATRATPPSPRPTVLPAQPTFGTSSLPTAAGLRQGGRRFGQALWGPLARQSGVLWLEFTGVFFGLFAITAGLAAWKHRRDLLVPVPGRPQAVFALAMFLVFGYFTLSSFIKASRRSRA